MGVSLPLLLGVAKAMLGEDALLNTYGTSIIGPGESAQPVHVDDEGLRKQLDEAKTELSNAEKANERGGVRTLVVSRLPGVMQGKDKHV